MSRNYKLVLRFERNITSEDLKVVEKYLKSRDIKNFKKHGWTVSHELTKIKEKNGREILAKLPAKEILDLIKNDVEEFVHTHKGKEYKIKLRKSRYKIFADNPDCISCGLKGSLMILEKQKSDLNPHFNLYAVDAKGNEVLMTRDHITPKSCGGSDSITNLQTLCSFCNNLKSNSFLTPDQISNLRKAHEMCKEKGNLSAKEKAKALNMLKFFFEDE